MIAPARKGAHPRPPGAPRPRWTSSPAGRARPASSWSPWPPSCPARSRWSSASPRPASSCRVGHTEATADEVVAAVDAGARCRHPPRQRDARRMLAREPGPVGAGPGRSRPGRRSHRRRTPPASLDPAGVLAGARAGTVPLRLRHHRGPRPARRADPARRPGRRGRRRCRPPRGRHPGGLGGVVARTASRCCSRTTGCSLADAVATATSTPARLVGDRTRGSLKPGRRGDVTLVDTTSGFEVVATVVGGEVVRGRAA